MKKKVLYDITNIGELEIIDRKYFTLNQFVVRGTGQKIQKFVYEPRAQSIALAGFISLDFFTVKESDGRWVISETVSGRFIYKSKEPELKVQAVVNAIAFLKQKVKDEKGLWDKVNERLNENGMSPRYRAI